MSKTTLTGLILLLLLLLSSFEAQADYRAEAKSLADAGYRAPARNGRDRHAANLSQRDEIVASALIVEASPRFAPPMRG